jgi:hypothetical protein
MVFRSYYFIVPTKKSSQNSGELVNFLISFLKKQLANFINCILRSIANVMQADGLTDNDDFLAKLVKSHLELAKKPEKPVVRACILN